ncbi:MAG: hypothetical protein WAQ08_18315 [Aquabacterium sp.]|uniref:hypothetical protein n=1 Tax=Aquabacterium sp. TaxID=1872578 RepID=UPI003BB0ED1B
MPTSVYTALGSLCALFALQVATLQDSRAAPSTISLSDDISVTFDKPGTFTEEYGYDTESGSYYSQYFSFSSEGASELRVVINFNGYVPAGKRISFNLGGSLLPTIYAEEFKWVFSEPRASILIQGGNLPDPHPDGATIPLPSLPEQIILVLKVTDYEPGKYKACRNGDTPLCETYSAEDLGILHVGVGYSITPVPEPGTVQLGFAGGLALAALATYRHRRTLCSPGVPGGRVRGW